MGKVKSKEEKEEEGIGEDEGRNVSLVLIPHGSLERSAEQDHDRFLFSSWGHFFSVVFLLSAFSPLSLSRTTPCVIVVRKVRERERGERTSAGTRHHL